MPYYSKIKTKKSTAGAGKKEEPPASPPRNEGAMAAAKKRTPPRLSHHDDVRNAIDGVGNAEGHGLFAAHLHQVTGDLAYKRIIKAKVFYDDEPKALFGNDANGFPSLEQSKSALGRKPAARPKQTVPPPPSMARKPAAPPKKAAAPPLSAPTPAAPPKKAAAPPLSAPKPAAPPKKAAAQPLSAPKPAAPLKKAAAAPLSAPKPAAPPKNAAAPPLSAPTPAAPPKKAAAPPLSAPTPAARPKPYAAPPLAPPTPAVRPKQTVAAKPAAPLAPPQSPAPLAPPRVAPPAQAAAALPEGGPDEGVDGRGSVWVRGGNKAAMTDELANFVESSTSALVVDDYLVNSAVEFAIKDLGKGGSFDKVSFFGDVKAAADGLKAAATAAKTVVLASGMWKLASGCPFAKLPVLARTLISAAAEIGHSPLEALREGVAATPGMQRKLAGRGTFLATHVVNGATGNVPPPPTTPGAPVASPPARFDLGAKALAFAAMAIAAEDGVVAFGGRVSKDEMNTGKGKEGRLANDGFTDVVAILNGKKPLSFEMQNYYADSDNYLVQGAEVAMENFIAGISQRKSVFGVESVRAMGRKERGNLDKFTANQDLSGNGMEHGSNLDDYERFCGGDAGQMALKYASDKAPFFKSNLRSQLPAAVSREAGAGAGSTAEARRAAYMTNNPPRRSSEKAALLKNLDKLTAAITDKHTAAKEEDKTFAQQTACTLAKAVAHKQYTVAKAASQLDPDDTLLAIAVNDARDTLTRLLSDVRAPSVVAAPRAASLARAADSDTPNSDDDEGGYFYGEEEEEVGYSEPPELHRAGALQDSDGESLQPLADEDSDAEESAKSDDDEAGYFEPRNPLGAFAPSGATFGAPLAVASEDEDGGDDDGVFSGGDEEETNCDEPPPLRRSGTPAPLRARLRADSEDSDSDEPPPLQSDNDSDSDDSVIITYAA